MLSLDDTLRCKRFNGFCDEFDSVKELSGMYRGKAFDENSFEAFCDRFDKNELQTDEQLSYNMWTSDTKNPDPDALLFDTCPTHKRLLLRILYGQVCADRNEFYCYENCLFGSVLLKTSGFNHYIQIVYEYLSGCSEVFSLYGDKDIVQLMKQKDIDPSSEEELEEELFFVKRCISAFYSGQMIGMSDNREKDEKEREEKQKAKEANNRQTRQSTSYR